MRKAAYTQEGRIQLETNKQTVTTCIKVKYQKLREELNERKANSGKGSPGGERDESGRGCGCSPGSPPLPCSCSARKMEIGAPPLPSPVQPRDGARRGDETGDIFFFLLRQGRGEDRGEVSEQEVNNEK